MTYNLPTPVCPTVPWCTSAHPLGRGEVLHSRQLGDFTAGDRGCEVSLYQREENGVLGRAVVNVTYGPDWAPALWVDIPLDAASALSDILANLPTWHLSAFALALAEGPRIAREAGRA